MSTSSLITDLSSVKAVDGSAEIFETRIGTELDRRRLRCHSVEQEQGQVQALARKGCQGEL